MSDSPGKLRLGALVALVVGSMIGGGIFSLPQNMAASADVGAILIGWAITAVGMLTLAFVFTKANASMPTAVIAHPINTAAPAARSAIFCGNEKIPPPIIDPTTNAINALSRSFCVCCDIVTSLFCPINHGRFSSYRCSLVK